MGVSRVTEKLASRDGDDALQGGLPMKTRRRTLIVHVTNYNDDEETVCGDNRIPRLYSTLTLGRSAQPGLICTQRIPRQTSKLTWEVECIYKLVRGQWGTNPLEMQGPPLARPPTVVWGSQVREVYNPDFMDARGHAVKNTAGQPLSPGVPEEKGDLVCTVTRNEPTFRARELEPLLATVNAKPFAGYGVDEVKLAGFNARSQWEQYLYWVVTYQFHMRSGGWLEHCLNRGRLIKKTPEAGSPESYMPLAAPPDANGVITGEIVNLNADGTGVVQEPMKVEQEFYRNRQGDFGKLQMAWLDTFGQ